MKSRYWAAARSSWARALLGLLIVAGGMMSMLSSSAAGQSGAAPQFPVAGIVADPNWTPPRTPWGDPDLQGTWDNRSGVPLERDKKYGTREFLTEQEAAARSKTALAGADDDGGGLDEALVKQDIQRNAAADRADDGRPGYRIAGAEYNAFWNAPIKGREASLRTSMVVDPPDGRIPPYTAETLTKWEAREQARRGRSQGDDWEDRAAPERCIVRSGLPAEMNSLKEIVQSPGYVAIQLLYQHTRIIPVDGRPHTGPTARPWWGNPRGRWEGNTLVIETINFRDQIGTVIPSHGGPFGQSDPRVHAHYYPGSGDTFRLVERITRIGPNHIEYKYTVDDPKTFVRPFTVVNVWSSDDAQRQMFEYACHEHNYGMVNALAGARVDPKWALDEAKRESAERLDSIKAEWEQLKAWQAANKGGR